MKIKTHSFKALLVVVFSIGYILTFSQNLLKSRHSSFYTYIYKLTDQEAKQIYQKDLWVVDQSFFHTLVDSFPTDREYLGKLPTGHYIKTYAEKNKQQIFITSVQNVDVHLLNNNTDLCMQVYDLDGNIIPDAIVKVNKKTIRFDIKTQSYTDKKSNKKGLFSVTYNGHTNYYDLWRQYDNSGFRRGTRAVVYDTPIKYIWIPVRYILFLPADAVASLVQWRPHGTIYNTKKFFVNAFEKIACIFDNYYCYDRSWHKQKGYLVFNKPRYQPGDTVKFKAFLLTKKGKPVNKQLSVNLRVNNKDIELTQLSPYRKGAYEYQFYLHDSLELKLDRSYYVTLSSGFWDEYIHRSFKYEDYELAKNKLTLRTDEEYHYQNKSFSLFVKGTDENDLNLLDANLEVLIKPVRISEYFDDHVFVPDTILHENKKLEPTGETEIIIPDSTFPNINFEYDILVRLRTSDNEITTENTQVRYFYLRKEIDLHLESDSLYVVFKENGIPQNKRVTVFASDNFGNETEIFQGYTPFNLKINPYYSEYTAITDSAVKSIDISSQPSLLQCFSERTKDSIHIIVDNPRKLIFNYNIYKKNNEQSKGITDSLDIIRKIRSKQNYFISLRYLWGGQVYEENYSIPYLDKSLQVSVMQPKIVYPGQKTNIEILVTDADGQPVPGVDLTAYSLTKKFKYTAPELPYLGKIRKNKSLINNFTLEDFDLKTHPGWNLDYDAWKIIAGLDSIAYYQFIYPGNSIYRFEYCTPDSITQFAPFVVSGGAISTHSCNLCG